MTQDEIRDALAKILVERLNCSVAVGEVGWNSSLRDDLGIDSLAVAELMYEIEDTFGTALEDTEPTTLVTVRDAVHAIARELQVPLAS